MAKKRDPEKYVGLWRSQLTNHYKTQASLIKKKEAAGTAGNKIIEYLQTNVVCWLYHYLKSRLFTRKHPFVNYQGASSNGVFEMQSDNDLSGQTIKIVIAADWASDTEESDLIGKLMLNEAPDYSIHLGDVYFVGTPQEIKSNFINANNSWPKGKSGSLALPGNHEFYSNGNPFYEYLLPAMFIKTKSGTIKQEASFFCLQNNFWRVIGLDTGYYSVGPLIWEYIVRPDAHLDEKQVDWIKQELNLPGDKRGLVFLSHHQYCSGFEKAYTKAAERLKEIIGGDREVLWIWGHEHRFAVYGKYQSQNGIKAYGRCIGHGGMPPELGKVKNGKDSVTPPDVDKAEESKLVFFDGRKKNVMKSLIIGHNGFAVMSFENEKLRIEYKDEKQTLFAETWEIEIQTGRLKGKVNIKNEAQLTLVSDSYDQAVD